MTDPIVFERIIQGELPFTLNLPDGVYPVRTAAASYELEILQRRLAVAADASSMLFGTVEELQPKLRERWDEAYKHELRSVVRHQDRREVPRAELPTPDHGQLFQAAQQHLMRNTKVPYAGPSELQEAARQALAALGDDVRVAFATDTSIRLAADVHFPAGDVEQFCRAVNALVRLYMATFQDAFVEEVTERSFSGTAFHGVYHYSAALPRKSSPNAMQHKTLRTRMRHI